MFYIKSLPDLVLPTFLLFFSLLSNGVSQIHPEPTHHFPVIIGEYEEYTVVSWEIRRRSVLDEDSTTEFAKHKSMILAAKRTHRKDPLDNFRYYKGGWNIREKHYFFSAAYTAAPLFLITAIWFLGFTVTLLVICIRHCCLKLSNFGYSRMAYTVSLIFLIFLTIATIVGSIVLYTGQEKFHSSSTNTLNYIVHQANTTVKNLTIVSESLSAAKGVAVDQISLPTNVLSNINKVQSRINASTTALQHETDHNSDKIKHVLDSVRMTLITVASVMLFLAFLGFLLSIFGMQTSVYILAIVGWILATMALILCCLFLILHTIVGDTCVAMNEWVQNPTAQTALDDILPCVDNATAQETLSQSKDVTFQLVGVVNLFITSVSNIDPPPILPPNLPPEVRRLYYNQSGPLVPVLCNPFNSDMTDRKCAPGEVDLSNASQELSKYICQVSANGNCTTTGRLTPEFYNQIISAMNVGYTLYHFGPFLVRLVDCTFVRETFNGITKHHCSSLKHYNKWIFIGLVMVTIAIMFSLIFWVFYARERRDRVYTKQFVHLSSRDAVAKENGV